MEVQAHVRMTSSFNYSPGGQALFQALFETTGLKGVSKVRDAVRLSALFQDSDKHNGLSLEEGRVRFRSRDSFGNDMPSWYITCYLRGYRDAGGDIQKLWATWARVQSSNLVMLWKENPEDLLEGLIKPRFPQLIIKEVMAS